MLLKRLGFVMVVTMLWAVAGYRLHFTNEVHGLSRRLSLSPSRLSARSPSQKENLDSLKIDLNDLSEPERDRIAFIQKLTEEADQLIRNAGLPLQDDDDSFVDDIEIKNVAIKDTKWSGQSNVEEENLSQRNPVDIVQRPFLFAGDITALVIFAAIGRGNHGEGLDLMSIVNTAAPFLLTWTLISSFAGAYTRDATASQGRIIIGLLPAWALSIPSALAVRGYLKDYVPPTPFIIVSFVSTLVLLSIWRYIYIAAFGETSNDDYRKAGFFEVFKMIRTLIQRW